VPYYCGKLVNKMSKPTFLIHVSSHFVLQSEHTFKKNILLTSCVGIVLLSASNLIDFKVICLQSEKEKPPFFSCWTMCSNNVSKHSTFDTFIVYSHKRQIFVSSLNRMGDVMLAAKFKE
jgi:hypothetical protein